MSQIDVLAVVGSCAPERLRYAKRLAAQTQRMFVPAQHLAVSPDPVDEASALAPWTDKRAGVVFEFPAQTSMTELIGTLARPDAETRLTEVICVADAAHLLEDLGRDSYSVQRVVPWRRDAGNRYTAHAMLTVMQLEYASTIVLVNWDPLSTPELSTVMALVSHLSPRARLRLAHTESVPGSVREPYAVGQEAAGWVAVLNGEHDPHMTDARVSAFRYENVRPLHPGRLRRLLDEQVESGAFGSVIRSAGFCRLATRPHVVARWEHVGRMISLEPIASDILADDEELLAVGQELAFIGLDLDREALSAALDEAALSDAELAVGPEAWARMPDPFPAWPAVADRAD